MMAAERVLDLSKRFADFADTSARFSKSLVRETPEFANLPRAENVQMNLRIARTVFSKWSVDIATLLYTNRSVGFQEIRKALEGIQARVLSAKLKQMERMDLVQREVLPTNPPRVQYSLTEKGLRAARLAEPLFLYLRLTEGLPAENMGHPGRGRATRAIPARRAKRG